MKTSLRILAIAATAFLAVQSAQALDGAWTAQAGLWNTGSNWSTTPTVPGGAGSTIGLTNDITAARIVTIDTTSATVGTLNIGDPTTAFFSYTLAASGGASLIMNNSGIGAQINQSSTSNGDTISASISIADTAGLTIANAAAAKALTISGAITGSGSLALNGGAGGITLSGTSNTFAGNVSVGTNSKLTIAGDGSLGAASNTLSLAAGSTLTFSAATILNHATTVAGGVTMATPINAQQTLIAGNITGSGGITFTGAGFYAPLFMLSGNNSYGNTTISNTNRGGIVISSDANLGGASSTIATASTGTSALYITGTGLTNLTGHTFTFGSVPFVLGITDAANTFTWDKVFNATVNGAFTKAGAGTVLVTANQTYKTSNVAAVATDMTGGTLKVDYATGSLYGGGGNVGANNNIGFSGGELYLLGKGGSATTQVLGNVRLTAGGGTLTADNQSGSAAMLVKTGGFSTTGGGAFAAPVAGSSLNVRVVNAGTGGASVTTTALNDATGIIAGTSGARMTYNGTNWAYNTANATDGAYGGYSGYGALATTAGTDAANSLQTDSAALTGSRTTNTLKLTTSAASQSLDLAGNTLTLTAGGLLFTGANNYTVTGGTLSSGTGNVATNSDLIIHQYGSGSLTINSTIANGLGNQTLTKTGTGTLVLDSSNSYTGQTFVNGGVLSISANNQLGAVGTGAALNLNGTLQATSTFALDNSGANKRIIIVGGNGAGFDVTDSNTLTVSGALTTQTSGNPLLPSGGGLVLTSSGTGNGTLLLTNAGNNFIGGVTINGGTLKQGVAGALNSSGFNTLTFGSATNEKLQLNGFNATVSGLTSASTNAVVENASAANATFAVINGADNTYNGTIQNGTGAGTLDVSKAGAGTLTLGGVNTYTGNTTVTSGTLVLADNAGLKFVIAGNGISNKVTGTGTATFDGDFTFDLTGAGTTPGDSWTIADVTSQTFSSTFTVVGFTDNLDNTWSKINGGTTYKFSELNGIMNVVPEPSVVFLVALGLPVIICLRRRKARA